MSSVTKVGSSGISLSGGQRQRLVLARAVYACKDVVMLDDIFSGLDADTEEHISRNLFAKGGLFRRLGTTVLLVTHAVHRLSYADHIIVMQSGGSIAEQGSLEKLKANGGYVTLLNTEYKESADSATEPEQRETNEAQRADSDHSNQAGAVGEEVTRQDGDLGLYLYYLGSVYWASSVLWLGLFLFSGVSSNLSELLVNIWMDSLEKTGSSVNAFYIGLYGMLSIITTGGLAGGAYHYFLFFAPRSAESLHERLLESVIHAPVSFFTSVDIGTITNRYLILSY